MTHKIGQNVVASTLQAVLPYNEETDTWGTVEITLENKGWRDAYIKNVEFLGSLQVVENFPDIIKAGSSFTFTAEIGEPVYFVKYHSIIVEFGNGQYIKVDFTQQAGVEPEPEPEPEPVPLNYQNVTWIPILGALGETLEERAKREVPLHIFRLESDLKDNEALARALFLGFRKFHLVGGKGKGANGAYILSSAPWVYFDGDFDTAIASKGNLTADGSPEGATTTGITIRGDGPHSTFIIQERAQGYVFNMESLSDDPEDNFKDFTLRDLSIIGPNEDGLQTATSRQTEHMIVMHGVSNVLIENVHFLAMAGDAIWIANGPKPEALRFSDRVTIRNCLFDGVTKDNRNAISIEACRGITIENNHFIRCSEGGQPGPIDLEPYEQFVEQLNGDIRIIGNVFDDFGGAAFCLYMNTGRYNDKAKNYFFMYNTVRNGQHVLDGVGFNAEDAGSAFGSQCIVSSNSVYRVKRLFRLIGCNGILFTNNIIEEADGCHIGMLGFGHLPSRDIVIRGNHFKRAGQDNGAVIFADASTINCIIEDNSFTDCGRTDGLAGYAFLARGEEANTNLVGIAIMNNKVYNESGLLGIFGAMGDYTGYGPGAKRGGNELISGEALAQDAYNPPIIEGSDFSVTVTLAAPMTINAKQTYVNDFAVDGTRLGVLFDVIFPEPLVQNAYVICDARARDVQVIRSVIFNAGTEGFTYPAGTKIVYKERK